MSVTTRLPAGTEMDPDELVRRLLLDGDEKDALRTLVSTLRSRGSSSCCCCCCCSCSPACLLGLSPRPGSGGGSPKSKPDGREDVSPELVVGRDRLVDGPLVNSYLLPLPPKKLPEKNDDEAF